MTPNLVNWLSAPGSVEERRTRIADYLVNEGYGLPPSPRNADYDEGGDVHWVRGQEMTVAYSVVDQGGRRVYHYVEYEVDHIMLRRISRCEEWALEHLDLIPSILSTFSIIRGNGMWGRLSSLSRWQTGKSAPQY